MGVFLIAVGAVLLAAQAGVIDRQVVSDALRLWPLVLVAAGLGLILRRTPMAVPGGMVAAAMPGLLLGGLLVAAPTLGPVCGDRADGSTASRTGAFGDQAAVELRLACGELTVTTIQGSSWRLDTTGAGNGGANVDASTDRLSVGTSSRPRFGDWHPEGDAWTLRLPTATTLDIDARVDAGKGTFDLAGARLGTLRVGVNAGEARIDLTEASLARLELDVNAAKASVLLPAGDLVAHATVNAGSLEMCAPAGLGLRVHGTTALGAANYQGLVRVGDAWETPGYSTSAYHADVTISAAVGSVDVNSEGGCK
jgi:hypothetical protein